MQRVPKGQYFRDTWDWLGSDAIWAHAQVTVLAGQTYGLILKNTSQAGEFLDFAWIYVSTDNPAVLRLTADPAPDTTGTRQNPQLSYVNVTEGAAPADIFPYNAPGQSAITIHQTAGAVSEFYWPKIKLGTFVRIPSNWGVGVRITAGAANTLLQVTWYAQFIGETDIHTGAPATLRRP